VSSSASCVDPLLDPERLDPLGESHDVGSRSLDER
jgi:hypothetical protein